MSTAVFSAAACSAPTDFTGPDTVVCRCLNVTVAEINTAASLVECPTACRVMELTGAGGGCTACHRHIRQMLGHNRRNGD